MSKRILIVDDAVSMRGLVGMTLRNAGYEITEASNGEDAVTKLGPKRFDLIISDLNMPRMDGIGLIKAVKNMAAHKFTPIIMLTTESQDSKKQEGKQAGAKAWLTKPFKPEVLLDVVRKVIGS